MEREAQTYARCLVIGVRVGFVALVASFVIYMAQILPPSVSPQELPRYWGLPYTQYIAATGAPTGWDWILRLGQSDLLNFVGVAILGLTTIAACALVVPVFARARERAFVAICVAEIAVLLAAASGIVILR